MGLTYQVSLLKAESLLQLVAEEGGPHGKGCGQPLGADRAPR